MAFLLYESFDNYDVSPFFGDARAVFDDDSAFAAKNDFVAVTNLFIGLEAFGIVYKNDAAFNCLAGIGA